MNKNTIFENLAGRTTPLQKQIIAQWLAEPGSIELYYEWLDEWENKNLQFIADGETALQNIIHNNIQQAVLTGKKGKKGILYRFLSKGMMAASVFIVILIAALYSFKGTLLNKSVSTGYGEIKSLTLPDGSQVFMNSNSIITYPRFGFGKSNRVVHLSGEADFAIVHTQSNQQFIVQTDKGLNVTVLGTRFSVYVRESRSIVALQNGKVELSYTADQANKKLILKPGDIFTVNTNTKPQLNHIQHPEKLTAWKNHEFFFDGTSLNEIAGMIKDNFGFEVKFENPEIAGKKISGSFHAVAPEELMNAISELLNINHRITGNTIVFF